MSRKNQFVGTIQTVIYEDTDPESDFAIVSIDQDEGYGNAKVKGDFPFVTVARGVRVKVKGEWNKHPEYGWTMKAHWAKEALDSEEGIRRFLENHVHTIGPKTSEKLINQFGEELIDFLDDEPEKIRKQADYLRSDQREQLFDKWEETKTRDRLGIYLYGLGLSSAQASKAINQFGDDVKDTIENDPFALLDVPRIGFQTCDQVCSRLKFSKDAMVRVKGTIRWALKKASQWDGHLYLEFDDLQSEMYDIMEESGIRNPRRAVDTDQIREAVDDLEAADVLVVEDGCIYLSHFYKFEDYCSRRIAQWSKDRDLKIDVDKYLSKWEDNHTITLSEEQREAVHALNETRFLIVAGLPGTGKCVAEDTLLSGPWGFSSAGGFLPDDLGKDDHQPIDMQIDTSEGTRDVEYIYSGGEVDTVKVTTETGFHIEGTPDHPIRVVENGEIKWKELAEIEPDDPVALLKGETVYSFGDDEIPEIELEEGYHNEFKYEFPDKVFDDLARLLGYLIAEGSVVSSNEWSITTHDQDVRDFLISSFEDIFDYSPSVHYDKRCDAPVGIRIQSTQIIRWFRKLGVQPCYADSKSTPDVILQSSKSSIISYLEALFEGDGGVHSERKVVEYGTASEDLAYEVQLLLLSLGVVATRKLRSNGHWRIAIRGRDYSLFRRKIGFHMEALPPRNAPTNSNKHLLHGIQPLMYELFEEVKPLDKEGYNLFYRSATGRRVPTRTHVRKLLEFKEEENALVESIRTLLSDQYYYDCVEEIEDSRSPVVDFGVPSNHEFLAGGFINHNTTIVKALTGLFDKAGLRFHLMAPTGIAAKRLSNVTNHPAATIHRELGYGGEGRWQFNKMNKFPSDAVIVDEASMVSQKLLYRLISALPQETTLVLVGDHAQLPSVGAGNVLQELLECSEVRDTKLTKIFRQEEASDLVLNAHRINDGKEPDLGDPTDSGTDFKFIQDSDEDSIMNGILKITQKVNRSEDNTYQVLSPRYAGKLGVDSLNEHLRRVLNPERSSVKEHEFSNIKLREGDRVMVTENDYELEVFNGEVGHIQAINSDAKKFRVQIPGPDKDRLVSMEFSDAARLLTLAYCTTIHKCQGQEYDYVIFPFLRNFGIQLQRNLLYTAVTRAKKKCFIVGEWSAVTKAIRNEDNKDRNTRLGAKIESYSDKVEDLNESSDEDFRDVLSK